jgi:hypothetical protein
MKFETDIARNFLSNINLNVTSSEFEEFVHAIACTMHERFGKPLYPKANESLVVTFDKPKTAALAFDKVYRTPALIEPFPEEVGFYGATDIEKGWWGMGLLYLVAYQLGIKTDLEIFNDEREIDYDIPEAERNNLRFLCSQFPKVFHQTPTILYSSKNNYNCDFQIGKEHVLMAAISNVAMVDEKELDWKQVLEFRKDINSRIKYQRFMRWLDSEMLTCSPRQIEDNISIKMDDYQYSLKKHGIKTMLGTVSSLIDTKFIGAVSAATAATALAGGELLTALTPLSLMLGKTIITFSNMFIDSMDEARKENYEIAYIYEAKNKLIK